MVNGSLPLADRRHYSGGALRPILDAGSGVRGSAKHQRSRGGLLMQILGKLYFFDLRENSPIILFDYGQKRLGVTNEAFKAAC